MRVGVELGGVVVMGGVVVLRGRGVVVAVRVDGALCAPLSEVETAEVDGGGDVVGGDEEGFLERFDRGARPAEGDVVEAELEEGGRLSD